MMKWLRTIGSGLALLVALVAPSDAATIHVLANNRPGTDGSTKAEAYGSTFLANTAARADDRVLIYPGQYAGDESTIIAPDSAGSSPGQIYYHGVDAAGALNTSGTTVINGDLTLNSPYVSLTNVLVTGNLTLGEDADFCRVVSCIVNGNLTINGADYSTITNTTVHGQYWKISSVSVVSNRDSVRECSLANLGGGISNGDYPLWFGGGDPTVGADSCVFYNNDIAITAQVPCTGLPGCPGGAEWWTGIMRYMTNCKFRDNDWTINAPLNTEFILRFRDATAGNTFDCDTLIASGAGSAELWWAVDGNAGIAHPSNNDVDSCLFDFSNTASSNGVFFYTWMNNIDFTYTTILGKNRALVTAAGIRGTNVFDHCTFVAEGAGGVLRFKGERPGQYITGDTVLTIKNSAIALLAPFTENQSVSPYSGGADAQRAGIWFTKAVLDSAGQGDLLTTVDINNNAYSYWGSTQGGTVGDRSLMVHDPNEMQFGYPGDNSGIEARYNGIDSLSVHGSLQFGLGGADSTIGNVDPRIGQLSIARGVGEGGTDAGAVAYDDNVGGGFIDASQYMVVFFYGIPDSVEVTLTNYGTGYVGLDPADQARTDGELNGYALPTGVTVTDTPNVPAAQSYILDATGGADAATITLHWDGVGSGETEDGSLAWFVVNDSRWGSEVRSLGTGPVLSIRVLAKRSGFADYYTP